MRIIYRFLKNKSPRAAEIYIWFILTLILIFNILNESNELKFLKLFCYKHNKLIYINGSSVMFLNLLITPNLIQRGLAYFKLEIMTF